MRTKQLRLLMRKKHFMLEVDCVTQVDFYPC